MDVLRDEEGRGGGGGGGGELWLKVCIKNELFPFSVAGEDYNSTTVPLVFTGQDIFVINLTLINNIRMDTENETFTVQLVLDDPPPNLQVGLASATVTIIENGRFY